MGEKQGPVILEDRNSNFESSMTWELISLNTDCLLGELDSLLVLIN